MSIGANWEKAKLGDICHVVTGNTPPKSHSKYYGGSIPWIKPDNLDKEMYVQESTEYLSDEGGSLARLLPAGSVLVSCIGNLGKIAIAGITLATNQQINALIPSDKIDSEFLFFACSAIRKKLSQIAAVTIVPIVNKSAFSEIEIPVPPIEKQRQIAARLKAQLAEVAKARQAAEAQLSAAKALSIVILREVFERNSAIWPAIKLGDAGDVAAGITLGGKTNGKQTRHQVQYLRVANVKDGSLDLTDVKTIEATNAEIEKLRLRQGDILLTEGGDPDKLGRGTFWQEEIEECIHQNHIFRVRFPSDKYLPEFVAAQIGSTYGKDYFLAHAKKTTGIATINQQVLKAFPLLIPDLGTQKTVMLELSERLQEAHAIIEAARKQIDEINTLPQKILAQAFDWQER